ncbi:sugar phosphate isomerase/epimerase [Paenarthrobacter sp. NPDC089322]|uniref:sugar phosphate isomerase/epimerase family protein n=1 Tax=Paenarthrobacter sp. NPDC089322 TaxID=3155065 RepID=UPI0034238E64
MNINKNRIALNPLQYMATDDGWIDPSLAPPLEQQLEYIASQGFKYVHCSVPPGLSPDAYRRKLESAGLEAGPGYVGLRWSDDPEARLEHLRRSQATAEANAAVGSELSFLALGMTLGSARVDQHSAVGYQYSADRMDVIIDYVGEAAELVNAAGVVPALHPHVGTWIETESETRTVLEGIPSSTLKFGPDTGHLAWAGADVTSLLSDYADRISGVHIKDLFMDTASVARSERLDYKSAIQRVLWTEPGTGDADFNAIFNALPSGYVGWTVIEVDKGNRPTAEESIEVCGKWLKSLS